MKIDGSTLTQLLSSLDEYNPAVNQLVEKISKGIIPVAMVILGVFMYIELNNTTRRMQVEQNRLGLELFISVTWKYFVGFCLIMFTDEIFDSIVWIVNAAGNIISHISTKKSDLDFSVPEIKGKLKGVQKMIVSSMGALAQFVSWFAEIVTKILVFFRAIELYIFKAAAPLLVAFFVNDEWRPITMKFIKMFTAVALQGILIIIILSIYPAVATNDMLDLVVKGDWLENLSAMFLTICKGVIFIMVLLGSQRKAKEWMGG